MQVQNETKPYDTINVTPMLDLAYVLLVVFILMTTASVQGININMPKPSAKPPTEKHEMHVLTVTPDGSGNVWTANTDGTVTQLLGLAAPTATPLVPSNYGQMP